MKLVLTLFEHQKNIYIHIYKVTANDGADPLSKYGWDSITLRFYEQNILI